MSERPRLHEAARVTLILLCLVLPAAGSLVGHSTAGATGEKRRLAAFPAPPRTPRDAASWPRRFDAWLADNFGLRRPLLAFSSWVKVMLLQNVPSPSTEVLIGRDGWLYYTGNHSIEYMQRTNPFKDADLEAWCTSLEARRRWLGARGSRFLFVLVPDKQTIYPEHLPSWVRTRDLPSRADQLLAALESRTGVATLDLRPVLREAARHERVYQVVDSHWNSLGAYAAYAAIARAMGPAEGAVRPRPVQDFTRVEARIPGGDLATMLGVQSYLTEDQVWLLLPEPHRAHEVDASAYASLRSWTEMTRPVVTESSNAEVARAVFLRDSFFELVREPLAEHIGRAVFVWFDVGFPADMIERENPQVVVLEMVERLITDHIPPGPPADPTAPTAATDADRARSSPR
jgi:alginate O-acetyltransferase complex protein AlgJ